MRWWGPLHQHYAMTDLESLAISLGITIILVSVVTLSVRTLHRKRLHWQLTHREHS